MRPIRFAVVGCVSRTTGAPPIFLLVRVSESGIHSAADVKVLMEAGYQAFLVGEHLMKAEDPAAALRALTC